MQQQTKKIFTHLKTNLKMQKKFYDDIYKNNTKN